MKLVILLVIIVGAVAIAGCGTPTGDVIADRDVRIGAILHLTANDYSTVGAAFREGIDLAVAEQNAKGGLGGRQVVVVYEDSQYDMKQVATAANKLATVDAVSAAMISTNTELNVAGPIFEQGHIPLVTLWDSSREIDGMGDYIFGMGADVELAGTTAAEYSYSSLGVRRVIIINNNAPWSQAISESFKTSFAHLGGVVVDEQSPGEGTTDFRTIIAKSQNTPHDGLYVATSSQTDILFKQLRDAGYDRPIMSTNSVTQQTIDAANGAAEGTYHTVLLVPQGDRTERFKALYEKHYGKTSDQLLYVGLGYDGAKTLMHAIELGGPDREAIKDAMYRVKDLDGAFSTISIGQNGSYSRYESVVQVRDGKDVVVQR